MDPDHLGEKSDAIQQRLTFVLQAIKQASTQPTLLSEALEELSVTIEELHQQSEELALTQQSLALERQRYQDLFEFAPDGYLVTTIQGVIQEANQMAATLLNIQSQFLVGKPLVAFVAETDRQAFCNQLNQFIRGKPLTCKHRDDQSEHWRGALPMQDWEIHLQPRGDPPSFPAAVVFSTVCDPQGKWIGLRCLIRDITAQKQAEAAIHRALAEAKDLNDLKSRFIQTVSHEFRTPLSIIRTAADLLEHFGPQVSEEKKRQYFQAIRDAVTYATQLFDDILIFNKAEAGKLPFNPQPLDLVTFCQQVVEEQRLSAGDRQAIRFNKTAESIPACLDEQLLHQILSNLLSNARKYSPEGGEVDFELTCQNNQAIFRVQDQGIGIPPADQPHLFEPFHRAQNVEHRPGTGLGLAIVKKAVDLHGGGIALESQVGRGATFTVTLPLAPTV